MFESAVKSTSEPKKVQVAKMKREFEEDTKLFDSKNLLVKLKSNGAKGSITKLANSLKLMMKQIRNTELRKMSEESQKLKTKDIVALLLDNKKIMLEYVTVNSDDEQMSGNVQYQESYVLTSES